MEFEVRPPEEQSLQELVKSLELVSARVLDSIVTAGQMASSNTPEMRHLFDQWVAMLGGEVLRAAAEKGEFNPAELAASIGVQPSTVVSLALGLYRQGKLDITGIKAKPCDDSNREICGCLK
jgi:hypothetical protein